MWQNLNPRPLFNTFLVIYAFMLPLSRASVGIATAVMILLFVMQGDIKRQLKQIVDNTTTLSILLFVLYYCLNLFFVSSEELKYSVSYIVPYLYLLPSVLMMGMVDRRTIPKVVIALIAGVMVSEVISYGIFFGLWEKSRVLMQNPSPFMHHIQYSTFLALLALFLLYYVFQEKRVSYKISASVLFLAMVATLFLINGRTGQVAFIFGLLILGLTHFQNRLKALLVSSILIVFVLGSAYSLSDNFRDRITVAQSDIHKMIDEGNFSTSLGYRVGVMILSLDLIKQNPLLGTGVADTMPMIKMEAKRDFPNDYFLQRANHLQNQYLQVLVELGFVGLGLLMWMLYKIARIPLRSKNCRTMKIILISVYFLTMFSDIQLHIQFTAGLFALITGILLAQSRIESEEAKKIEGVSDV